MMFNVGGGGSPPPPPAAPPPPPNPPMFGSQAVKGQGSKGADAFAGGAIGTLLGSGANPTNTGRKTLLGQ